MIKSIIVCALFSSMLILIVISRTSNAATTVLYEFHIREANVKRNETGVLKNGNSSEPELIITGTRTSTVILQSHKPNGSSCIYKETAVYNADKNGYRVKYNYSLVPFELDTRLHATTLKIATG
ncbi:uncharacterized protein LOC115620959 [Scaptodrosophila lebanonensis]|uniref:Uncharacterized protein LOC115620959 n=1 Tax=Drosophila lebanonensis TaxID=7225 RepID=A0A6J2T5E3_DROLE|nr:uncharacterized protein LOC115620959 [Scaptodrosophila lebanonensis]